jgi:hypothetical protein
MTTRALTRLTLLLSLLGGTALQAGSGLAAPWRSGTEPWLRWVQAQRDLTEQSYQKTLERLDVLEQCLGRVRGNRSREQCLRRDQRAQDLQQQQDRSAWETLQRRLDVTGMRYYGRDGL